MWVDWEFGTGKKDMENWCFDLGVSGFRWTTFLRWLFGCSGYLVIVVDCALSTYIPQKLVLCFLFPLFQQGGLREGFYFLYFLIAR